MSLDDQYWRMKQFQEELDSFNQKIFASLKEVEFKYDNLNLTWQDDFRRQHDQDYLPSLEWIKQYLRKEGPAYTEYLTNKLQVLERYLRGG